MFVVAGAAIMEFLLLPFYIRLKHRKKYVPLKLVLKGCMTLIPVVICAMAFFRLYGRSGDFSEMSTSAGFQTSPLVLAGLCVCLIADIVLAVNFPAGMVLFLLGHICYILYFIRIGGYNPLSAVILIVAYIFTYRSFSRFREAMGRLWPAYYLYALTIDMTLSVGLMLPFGIGLYGVIPALASCLLVISDYMLAANRLTGRKRWSDLMYLSYYFNGQFFLALSVFGPVMMEL